jgi:hypothetical protein
MRASPFAGHAGNPGKIDRDIDRRMNRLEVCLVVQIQDGA